MNIWLRRLGNFARRPRWESVRFWAARLGGAPRHFEYHVLRPEPLVLVAPDQENTFELLRRLQAREAWVFLICTWTLEAPDRVELMRRFQAWSRTCPRHRIFLLANSAAEKAILDSAGLPGILCSHNCLLDERIYNLQPPEAKRFRAIYDARLTWIKRHELAARVEGLALVTYLAAANHDDAYVERTRRELAHATWLNGPFAVSPGPLPADAVARAIRQSRTGLILSAKEGGNFASAQYLLCGVPVVTTPSSGGRDVFFHPDYVVTVEPEPEAVAAGVEALIRRQLDPAMIRERTLAIVREHRRTFVMEVARLLGGAAMPADIAADWERTFVNKMNTVHSAEDVAALARGGDR
ncbi:MAG TPA: hypothetical protein VHE13_14355 [Opitutus sp.]|nr:hypothetical protein [Opitutus sp.]